MLMRGCPRLKTDRRGVVPFCYILRPILFERYLDGKCVAALFMRFIGSFVNALTLYSGRSDNHGPRTRVIVE